MKKFISILLAFGMAVACFGATSCKKKKESTSNEMGSPEGKTVIKVASYNGGLGLGWLEDAAVRFVKQYGDQSFEEGKHGVYIDVVEAQAGDMLATKSLNEDLYLTESVDYYYMQSQGKFADISDVVTGDLSSVGESGKSIFGKMDKSMSDFLKAKDGNYYAIPFYDGFYGFIYDVDMFEGKGWFFDESGKFTKTDKSKGIDGVKGTYDDGMPKTYAQFNTLVSKIRDDQDEITPFVYGGSDNEQYFIEALSNFWANYEGKEDMQRNWTLSGETDLITGWNGSTPIIQKKAISESNRFDLQKQVGKYHALRFMREVVTGNGENYTDASNYKAAQLKLIQSYLDGDTQPGAVAMIIDGSWFENEAELTGSFNSVADLDFREGIEDKDYKTTRRFAFMPIPMVDETCSTKQTLISSNETFCFINAATSGGKLKVAKEFLKFLHTDVELATFTKLTSITRPYTYTISEADQKQMTYFGKSLMQMKTSADIVYPYSDNLTYIANCTQMRLESWAWTSKFGTQPVTNPFSQFRLNKDLTAKDYFDGLYKAY